MLTVHSVVALVDMPVILGMFQASQKCCHSSSIASVSELMMVRSDLCVGRTYCSRTPCSNKNLTELLQYLQKFVYPKLMYSSSTLKQHTQIIILGVCVFVKHLIIYMYSMFLILLLLIFFLIKNPNVSSFSLLTKTFHIKFFFDV